MTNTLHGERASIQTVLTALHSGFGKNLASIDEVLLPYLDKIDLQSRMISESKGQILNDHCSGPVQKKICEELFDEIFSDFSLAMYFCAGGLIVPSQMSTRRAFELGIATIYLWDLPHAFWGWRNRDDDLSFSAMIAHLNSTGYLEYLKKIHNSADIGIICKQANFQKIYRELSNTVHGKTTNLPPLSPARFSLDDSKSFVIKQFKLIEAAQYSILQLIFGRFPNLEESIYEAMPQLKRK